MDVEELAEVIKFNFSPSSYIDRSWITHLPDSSVVDFLLDSDVGSVWASQHILEAYGLTEKYDLDFSRQEKTLALVSRNQLISIVYYAGLALNGYLLKNFVKRQERQAIESCIGRECYNFALKKGTFISGTLAWNFDSSFVIDWNNLDELKKHIFRSGIRLLGVIYGKESEAFKKRLLFRFPMQSQDYFYAGHTVGCSDDITRQSGIMLCKLMKEFIL